MAKNRVSSETLLDLCFWCASAMQPHSVYACRHREAAKWIYTAYTSVNLWKHTCAAGLSMYNSMSEGLGGLSCDMNNTFVSSFVMVCFHTLSSMDNGQSMENVHHHHHHNFSNLILTFNLRAKGGKPGKPFDFSDTLFGFAVFTFSQIHWEEFSVCHETSEISCTDSYFNNVDRYSRGRPTQWLEKTEISLS